MAEQTDLGSVCGREGHGGEGDVVFCDEEVDAGFEEVEGFGGGGGWVGVALFG